MKQKLILSGNKNKKLSLELWQLFLQQSQIKEMSRHFYLKLLTPDSKLLFIPQLPRQVAQPSQAVVHTAFADGRIAQFAKLCEGGIGMLEP